MLLTLVLVNIVTLVISISNKKDQASTYISYLRNDLLSNRTGSVYKSINLIADDFSYIAMQKEPGSPIIFLDDKSKITYNFSVPVKYSPDSNMVLYDFEFKIELLPYLKIFLLSIITFFVLFILLKNALILHVRSKVQENLKVERSKAIAETTQIIAHDVRKPFSMLKSSLSILKNIDGEDRDATLRLTETEVNKALHDANNLLEDIMEMGNTTEIKLNQVSLEELIKSSLEQISTAFIGKDADLQFDLSSRYVLGEFGRLKRVFTNILSNAVEASEDSVPKLWIRSEKEGRRVKITIGNSGSFIEKEDRSKLFDNYFTKGKKDGTGLGLYICKKVVEAHGGSISIHSSKAPLYTEFSFDLEEAESKLTSDLKLKPELSDYLPMALSYKKSQEVNKVAEDTKEELQSEKPLKKKIAILDDEPLYRKNLEKLILSSSLLKEYEIYSFSRYQDLENSSLKFDALITDLDLEDSDFTGYDAAKLIRKRSPKTKICVHSNNKGKEVEAKSFESGADIFLAKPAEMSSIEDFLLKEISTNSLHIIVLDDEKIYLNAWKASLENDAKVHLYEDTSYLVEDVYSSKIDLTKIDIIICDFYFKNDDVSTNKIGEFLRNKGFKGKLLLSSNGIEKELPKGFDRMISKETVPFSEILKLT